MNILALDLGKYNTVFCEYNSADGEHEFGKVKTTPRAIHDLIVEKEPHRVVLEVCNIAGWVVDIARALGKETETANTTHDAWRWKNVKKKNDREDALKLAKLPAMNQFPDPHHTHIYHSMTIHFVSICRLFFCVSSYGRCATEEPSCNLVPRLRILQ